MLLQPCLCDVCDPLPFLLFFFSEALLEDFLSQQEEDLWRPRGKLRLSVGKIHLVRSVRYEQLQAPEPGGPRHTKGALVNQAFVQADQSL